MFVDHKAFSFSDCAGNGSAVVLFAVQDGELVQRYLPADLDLRVRSAALSPPSEVPSS